MRILFIRHITTSSFPMLGFGMGIIATIAHNAGNQAKVIDNNSAYKFYSDKEFVNIIKSYHPDLIAFSLTMYNALPTYNLVAKIKKIFPDKFLLGGGIHMKYSAPEALRYGLDMVVEREGETVILPLLDYLKDKTKENFREGLDRVSGISFVRDGGALYLAKEHPAVKNLDEVPFVDYDLFNLKDYFKTGKEPGVILICGQRGCPFQCTFCSDEIQRADNRVASADYMFNYVGYLHKKYGLKYVVLADNNFTYPRQRAADFCNKIINSSLYGKVKFSIQTKAEMPLDHELLKLLKEAGVVSVGIGVERADPDSSRLIKKYTPYEKTIQALQLLREHDLGILIFFLIGFPFETEEKLQKEREAFLNLMQYTKHIVASVLQPMPGTIYYDYLKAKNWYLNDRLHRAWRSYFYTAYNSWMIDQIDANFFDLPPNTIKLLKKIYLEFKDIDYAYYLSSRSIFIKLMKQIDRLLAQVSKLIYPQFPSLELLVFNKLKFLRYYFGTMLLGDKVF